MHPSRYLSILVFLAVGVFVTHGQHGVKGGRYQQPSNETGYCYKRVPYHQAQSLYNDTESHAVAGYGQGARPHWNSTYSNGWVTVLDCCEGYQKNPSTNRCESTLNNCVGGCFGGACLNGICTCDQGWYPVEGVCKPICRRQCQQNAYCFAPDVCECKFGWEQLPSGDCRPVCPGGCINGDCIAPKVCQCKPGYVLNEGQQRCDAICEGGCPHGECTAPGVCRCYEGYVNPRTDRENCVPDCGPENCNGGQCISPGVCLCQPGYIKDSSNNCVPECRSGCPTDARCVAPERCVCSTGFQMDYRNNRCVPTGSSQHGGYQSAPGGYNQQQGSSGNSECERPCINGVCMGYNICNCNNGYVYDPQDPTRTRCVPSCPGGCPNGVCSGPNFCLCKPGYIKDRSVKGSQRCIPRHD